MPSQKYIEDQLRQVDNWIFVANKKHYLKELCSLLEEHETIAIILDGFYTSAKIPKETPGLFCVTDKNVLFIAEAKHKPAYERIDIEQIIEMNYTRTSTATDLRVMAGNNNLKLRTFAKEALVKTCIQKIWALKGIETGEISASTGASGNSNGQPKSLLTDVYDYLNTISLPGFLEKLTRVNEEQAADLDKTIHSSDNADSLINDISTLNFLFAEAKKINKKIAELLETIPDAEFREMLINDIIALSSLCSIADGKLTNNELIFMSLVVMPLNPQNSLEIGKKAAEINQFDSFPLHFKEDVLLYWKEVSFFIKQKKIQVQGNALLSMSYLKTYDERNATTLSDKAGSLLYTYSQCLVKADDAIHGQEEERLKHIHKIIYNKEAQQTGTDETSGDIEKVEEQETLEQVMEKINKLIGMANIKEQINTFINLIKVQKERQERKMPLTPLSLHAVFYGPPGTGKTTIARLLGKVYKCLGLLTKGHLIETDRAGLVAGYVGQTAIQVDTVVKKALDGILFIDEAYTLSPADSMGKDFGQEAIDTILKRMEDHRERLVVIVAGYPDEMQRFINSNPGLQSRFSRYFYFDHYKPEELIKIFEIFSKNVEFIVTEAARVKLLRVLEAFYAERNRSFGNGRLARNIFEKVVEKQANRIAALTPLTDELLCTITEDDIPEKDEMKR